MLKVQCHRLFTPFDAKSSGAISYIVSKHSQYPNFYHNDDSVIRKDEGYSYDPRSTYLTLNSPVAFNTNEGEIPYHIIDIYPYTIIPFSYSLTFAEGGSPAVQWEISGSNDMNSEWQILSSPPQNNSVCEDNHDQSKRPTCESDVSLLYQTIIPETTEKQYRYLRYRVLKDRSQAYNNQKIYLMRFKRIEFYGMLFGGISCRCTNYLKLFHFHISLLSSIIIFYPIN